ncbi:MAG: OsmC family protein [Oligoflexia bacterium]|nr:OsmC family protein [Oligoflexia bacterium]
MIFGCLVDKYYTRLTRLLDGREIYSDVNEELGGDDKDFNPHEMTEAALAACTLMTVKMYASRKNINVDAMTVKVKITKENKEETHFSREISFNDESLDQATKDKLISIADKCPIHRILTSNVTINTSELIE